MEAIHVCSEALFLAKQAQDAAQFNYAAVLVLCFTVGVLIARSFNLPFWGDK